MKFVTERPLTDPDSAAHKLVEIANAIEAVQDGRIFVELINAFFLAEWWHPGPIPCGPRPRDCAGLAVRA